MSHTFAPLRSQEDFDHIQEELSKHYFRSNDYLKEEEEDEKERNRKNIKIA